MMKKLLFIVVASVFLIACNAQDDLSERMIDTENPTIGAALPDPVDSDTLIVDKSFNFATARTIDIDFLLFSAEDQEASVSICTEYEPEGDTFNIDYTSCTVSGGLVNGQFKHSMEVTNDKHSVVAVVLFQNSDVKPMFKEFFVDLKKRARSNGTMVSTIEWKE